MLIIWIIVCFMNSKKSPSQFPQPVLTYSNCWFCSTRSLKSKRFLFAIENKQTSGCRLLQINFLWIHQSINQQIISADTASVTQPENINSPRCAQACGHVPIDQYGYSYSKVLQFKKCIFWWFCPWATPPTVGVLNASLSVKSHKL